MSLCRPARCGCAVRSLSLDVSQDGAGSIWIETEDPLYLQPWTQRTPALTAITLGTGGTNVQRYVRIGKTAIVVGQITLGSGGALTGFPAVDVPFTSAIVTGQHTVGSCRLHNDGTQFYEGACSLAPNSTALAFIQQSAPSGIPMATAPFTWGINDQLSYSITYETT